ncbi:hypothetical protein [Xenophilus sp.]
MMHAPYRRQRGVSLIFALIALVSLALATLALVRSIDSGALVLGNVGFKQDATVAADQASREAVAWLKTNVASLEEDIAASGYYASTKELNADDRTTPVDVTGQQYVGNAARKLIDWGSGSSDPDRECRYAPTGSYASCTLKSASGGTVNGNELRYTIFRLCSKPGSASDTVNNNCAKPLGSTGGASGRGALAYGSHARFEAPSGPYYRIVVRARGARNTVSFTETIVSFQ